MHVVRFICVRPDIHFIIDIIRLGQFEKFYIKGVYQKHRYQKMVLGTKNILKYGTAFIAI
jgi:hypothetical protein